MPKATVNIESQRFELKTCEGGFVELKVMSYGEYLRRRDLISKMSFKGQGKNTEAVMEMVNEQLTLFEFSKCIVDHNLEDDGGTKLDLTKAHALQRLDPRIGEEISTYIDRLNKWDEQNDDEGNGPLSDSETT
jgi:hypothetical protein